MTQQARNLSLSAVKVSCQSCSLAELCLPHGLAESEVDQIDSAVRRARPIERGKHLFRMGDNSQSLYVVRSGSVKTYVTTDSGQEHVVGFYLSGELLGFDAFETGKHSCSAVALETTSTCELPGDQLEGLCHTLPGLHHVMHKLVGKELSREQRMLLLLGKKSGEERLATFLLSLSARFQQRGFSATDFNLSMSRQDIGNYLGLAVETISRLFARFQEDKLLSVDRRRITILDLPRLQSMVGGCMGEPSRAGS